MASQAECEFEIQMPLGEDVLLMAGRGHDKTGNISAGGEHCRNDEKITVGNNRDETVGVDRAGTIGSNKTIQVGVNHSDVIGSNMSVTIGANLTENVAVDYAETVGAAMDIVIKGKKTPENEENGEREYG